MIVAGYPDYVGKECDDVLEDLIVAINDAGYFIEDIDGHEKNIVLQLEPGSVLPSDELSSKNKRQYTGCRKRVISFFGH